MYVWGWKIHQYCCFERLPTWKWLFAGRKGRRCNEIFGDGFWKLATGHLLFACPRVNLKTGINLILKMFHEGFAEKMLQKKMYLNCGFYMNFVPVSASLIFWSSSSSVGSISSQPSGGVLFRDLRIFGIFVLFNSELRSDFSTLKPDFYFFKRFWFEKQTLEKTKRSDQMVHISAQNPLNM